MLLAAEDAHGFGWVDWAVVAAFLAFTTIVASRLAGRQATIRDFFLGGRKLAWWAVCGSIIATEISAVTFVAVPSISFKSGGDLTYLQWGIGAIMARVLIGLFFVPKYYRDEIYSPYDYMGARLGPRVRTATTLLFFVGGILGQGARVYVTGVVLDAIAGVDLVTAIWIVGLFSMAWTLIGGITTVIWTDVIQCIILVIGALAALIFAVADVPGGVGEVFRLAGDAGKFRIFDTRADLSVDQGLWVGILAMPFLNLAALGLDQVMAQRIFCCRSSGQARLAIIASSVGQVMAVLMLLIGLALFAYFHHNPSDAATTERLARDAEYALPLFIVQALPSGIRGLVVAAVFAAAISSAALAALSQSTLAAFRSPATRILTRLRLLRRGSVNELMLSKVLVVFWGVVLCAMATACIPIRQHYDNVVHLVFGLVAYTYGPLLGIFLLAILPGRRSDRGIPLAVFAGVLGAFAASVHNLRIGDFECSDWIVAIGALGLLVASVVEARGSGRLSGVALTAMAAIAIAWIHAYEVGVNFNGQAVWPSPFWAYPIGTILTFVVGWGLGRGTDRHRVPARREAGARTPSAG